ncbi:MAG: Hpt domain-containing protein, partial [Betaproteobacteria bacterium]
MQANETSVDLDPSVNDLGPLAWVLDELRKSLDGANKALRRFVRDADLALGSDLAALDTSHLRIARQQLHQAEGALEMVGLGAAATVLRAMEAVTQRFVQRPELCTPEQASKVERASFALIEYLEALLRSKPVSAVTLFTQYRDLQEMVAAPRIHPADLWPVAWRWLDIDTGVVASVLAYDDVNRTRFDQAMLKVIKTGDPVAADKLKQLCLGLAAAQSLRQARIFWTLCAAYFEALSHQWFSNDVYVKRTSSKVLTLYIALARADLSQIDRLARDLLFFCAQAASRMHGSAPTLTAVLRAYGLRAEPKSGDYEARMFGRFDPAVLAQARKRIAVAKEIWGALSGGDTQKLKAAADQFSLVSDSLVKLDPASHSLAQALTRVMEATLRSGQAPTPQVAMEVATSVLYLEAAYDEVDAQNAQPALRAERLAQRLDRSHQGGEPEPLEAWMEDLYRRVSERQTMGSVVSELGVTIGLLEKSMDQFFRNTKDKASLQHVPGQLAQMRGVLSLLGLDQASQAVLHMRSSVEQILVDAIDEDRAKAAGSFDRLGNSLGALGFMVDMLNYQPALARKLFVFDQDRGEFRSVMGRTGPAVSAAALVQPPPAQEASAPVPPTAVPEALGEAPVPALTPPAAASESVAAADEEDAELREIFLEEAREVMEGGLATLAALEQEPSDISLQTTLRRAFHTLKGSARMVGLPAYGEAAWALEQLLNSWVAEQQPVSDDVRAVASDALHGLQAWARDIAAGTDAGWKSEPFRIMADALRTDGRRVPLRSGVAPAWVGAPSAPGVVPKQPEQQVGVEAVNIEELAPAVASPAPQVSAQAPFMDIDFDLLLDATDGDQPEDLTLPPELDVIEPDLYFAQATPRADSTAQDAADAIAAIDPDGLPEPAGAHSELIHIDIDVLVAPASDDVLALPASAAQQPPEGLAVELQSPDAEDEEEEEDVR